MTFQPETPSRSSRRPIIWAGAAAALALVAIAGAAFAVTRVGSSDEGAQDQGAAAKRVCTEEFVPGKLKAPATAKFSDVQIADVDESIVTTYTVVGEVDAQNGFGALIRSKFTCVAHLDGDKWVLNSATVD